VPGGQHLGKNDVAPFRRQCASPRNKNDAADRRVRTPWEAGALSREVHGRSSRLLR
jgi:hypothetical protein